MILYIKRNDRIVPGEGNPIQLAKKQTPLQARHEGDCMLSYTRHTPREEQDQAHE